MTATSIAKAAASESWITRLSRAGRTGASANRSPGTNLCDRLLDRYPLASIGVRDPALDRRVQLLSLRFAHTVDIVSVYAIQEAMGPARNFQRIPAFSADARPST